MVAHLIAIDHEDGVVRRHDSHAILRRANVVEDAIWTRIVLVNIRMRPVQPLPTPVTRVVMPESKLLGVAQPDSGGNGCGVLEGRFTRQGPDRRREAFDKTDCTEPFALTCADT